MLNDREEGKGAGKGAEHFPEGRGFAVNLVGGVLPGNQMCNHWIHWYIYIYII